MKRHFLKSDIHRFMSMGILMYLFMNDFLPGPFLFAVVVI